MRLFVGSFGFGFHANRPLVCTLDVNNIAVYLEEISDGKNTDLYSSAEKVLNGDKSDSAVADMMLNGFEQSREAQRFVYTKIGEKLNESNRYTADKLIKQYEKLSSNGIVFSKSITDTYNKLVDADENTSKGTFNYLVGKMSATMDAILPRASVEAEVIKKISDDIEENGLPRREATRNDNVKIDENAFVEGMWKDSPNTSKDNVKKSQLESVENFDGTKYNDTSLVTYRRVQGGHENNASQKRIIVNPDGSISIPNKKSNLSISVDDGEHAKYFLNKRGYDANIVEINVPKWFDDFLQETAIPQVNYKRNLLNQGETAPKITDITTPGKSFELPAPWIEWLEEYGTNAKEIYF